jgi:hypothetical protein
VSTSYERRERTTTLVEYHVPAKPEGLGYSYWGELQKAMYAIRRELGPDQAAYEDSVRIQACDDELVLSFEKKPAEPGCSACRSGTPHGPAGLHAF